MATQGTPWTREQNLMALWGYRQLELAPKDLVKSHLYRQIGEIIGRTEKAVERKIQNFAAWAPEGRRPIAPLPNTQAEIGDLFKAYWPKHMSELDELYPKLVAHFTSQKPGSAQATTLMLVSAPKAAAPFTMLTDRREIARAQQTFEKMIKSARISVQEGVLGHPGGRIESRIYLLEQFGFWAAFHEESNRYWNAFGLLKGARLSQLMITCEINFPFDGTNGRIAGCLLKDSEGQVWVGHRGRIGGGRKGIGKHLFNRQYTGEMALADEDGHAVQVALIGRLEDSLFLSHLAQFIEQVGKMKAAAAGVEPDWFEEEPIFKPEFSQSVTITLAGEKIVHHDHGKVIDALHMALTTAGYRVGNDKERDLFIVESNQWCAVLFEAKTGADTQSIYTALGQLYYHGRNHAVWSPAKVMVLPAGLNKDQAERLAELGVHVLSYSLQNRAVRFDWESPKAFVQGLLAPTGGRD